MEWIRIYNEDLNGIVTDIADTIKLSLPESVSFVNLLYASGLRIREVYETNRWSLNQDDTYTITTEKGSNPRIWPKTSTPLDMQTFISNGVPAYQNLRYSTFTKYFNRFNPYNKLKVGTHPITTHIFRYRLVTQMHLLGYSDQDIADYIGEASLDNLRGYYQNPIYRLQY